MTAPDRPRDFDDVIQLVRKNQLDLAYGESLRACGNNLVRDAVCVWRLGIYHKLLIPMFTMSGFGSGMLLSTKMITDD